MQPLKATWLDKDSIEMYVVVPGDIVPVSSPENNLIESIKWCPLKPGIRCAATIVLAAESH
ncbi:MAG: hypothetical protein AB7E27_05140, partial [Candidatus Methanomethylophilaceae archaeon]